MSSLGSQLTEQLSTIQSRHERHLETLLQISRAIGSIRDSRDLMRAIVRHVTVTFQAERSTLYQYDSERDELWSLVAEGIDGPATELRIKSDHGLAGRVFQTHMPLCVIDTLADSDFARGMAQRLEYVPRSMLIVPVAHRPGRCDGVLQVMHREPDFFSELDLPLLEAIAVQVGISLDNARLYESQRRQFDSFVLAFAEAIDARDPKTAIHSVNVANFAMGIAHALELGSQSMELLRVAGLLHDVGKIGVPEAVLTKPGRLDDNEFARMREHAAYSRKILSKIEFAEELRGLDAIAAAHHERLDGSGYPEGLVADQIDLPARILAVADVFDALTQDRHYRLGMSLDDAFAIIDEMTPHQLDATCVAALKRFMNYDG